MRILHTMLRVGDLERSIAFYTKALGMKLLRQRDYPDGKFTLAFLVTAPKSRTPPSSSRTTTAPRATSWAPGSGILRSASLTSARL